MAGQATYGEIGALTRDCFIMYLTTNKADEIPEPHTHQLMRVGGFALTNLAGERAVTPVERDTVRQLMTDPEYRGFGWSEVKHPKALQLYRMCAVRGWLNAMIYKHRQGTPPGVLSPGGCLVPGRASLSATRRPRIVGRTLLGNYLRRNDPATVKS